MAVSFRAVGTWAELIADGAVAIPPTPQAGDRMYLFARWKDFSVTAQVTSPVAWTELAEFADGAVGVGNGTGSVKVACWYRDWQSGDTDPTIDFSENPNNASAVIIVMAKDTVDGWLTPIAATAAITNWTDSSQIVSASSAVAVPSDGVVMGLVGIRDDTATMTRPSTGIDDSVDAVTWNGDYVEAPAVHHSTTTGFDGAADLGYRLVSIGATATLRMTGTISAAETGSALWVVQGIENNLITEESSHVHTADSLVLTQAHNLAVVNVGHAQSAANLDLSQVHQLSVQGAAHAQTAESLTLEQAHILQIQDAVHGHTADDVPVEHIHVLIVQDAVHAHAADATILSQVHELSVENGSHTHTAPNVVVLPVLIVFPDPGGDAVQAVGYFNTAIAGTPTFDTTQKVAGVGSYKFDSGAGGAEVSAGVAGVLGANRRMSFYFRYDSIPTATATSSVFFEDNAIYSGGGFADPAFTSADDGIYATATPARNAGQGNRCSPTTGLNLASVGSVIDSVKIIYERKYDVNTSIGISRVKWVVNGEEGPNHDNTDMPLVDTVVEVDVTADRGWTWQDFLPGFEIINEARRGDTDTAHTQSWDFLKVEIIYHNPANILRALDSSNLTTIFNLAITPAGSGVALRFADNAGASYDGISPLLPNTDHRISFGYVLRGFDNFDINLYVDGIQELTIDAAATGASNIANLEYGWVGIPGANHVCWFDQIYIDDSNDLSDPGDMRPTAKLPASVNENNWDTTGGTGAVDERPLSVTNFKQHAASTGVRQTYTLQTAATGDIDISSKTLIGYMGWAWAKLGPGDGGDALALITNNVSRPLSGILGATQKLLTFPVTSQIYPSHAAGIGMVSNEESADTFMYECGVVVVYRGPNTNPNILLQHQELSNVTLSTIVDDLRSNPPASYEVCWLASDSDAMATLSISTIHTEGGQPRQHSPFSITGSGGRKRIDPGIEVRLDLAVTNGKLFVTLWRRLNV